MSWIWLNNVLGNKLLALILLAVLAIDGLVWFSTKQLVKKERPLNSFAETTMDLLGSWYSLVAMGAFTIAWALYDTFKGKPTDTLDIVISIWTMLLDVLVIIGANYTKQKDRQTLDKIYKAIKKLEDE